MDQYVWLYFESELNFMICKLCVKHKKSNIMTGNECRNWKASTLKGHAHSADDKQSVVAKAVTWSFSVSNVFNETSSHTLCTELQIPKLTNVWGSTNEIRRLYTFVSIRNPFTLLIYLNQFIDNKWLLNSLHHLKISRVFYNDITKNMHDSLCSINDFRAPIFSWAVYFHFTNIKWRHWFDLYVLPDEISTYFEL